MLPEFRAVYEDSESYGMVEQEELKWQAQWYSATSTNEDKYERGGWYASEEEALEAAKRGKATSEAMSRVFEAQAEDINQKRIDTLKDIWAKGQGFGRKPYTCCSMAEAVKLLEENDDLQIATVAWWGELPAGYTWCELLQDRPSKGHYHVMQDTEPRPRDNWIPESEIVAVYWMNQFFEE